ncbi:MAG: phenylalanine--tRNA ligase subunit beta, partial [Candidatus Kerfeldbacteria bacterium RIFOXYC2_FULL_38_9]
YLYDWLKEYLTDIPQPEELLRQLSVHSVEVEKIIFRNINLDNVVVGELLEKKNHPNADKLNIGIFDVGEKEPRQIIFGQRAVIAVGQKIPVALAPTVLPGGVKIKKSKLRGEISDGMCCLNSELQILNCKDELNFFDQEIKNGTLLKDILGLKNSALIDIDNKSMTHRADLFCHVGMAREIAAVFGLPFQEPKIPKITTAELPAVAVTIENQKDCPRYLAAAMKVKIGESPDFIKKRLLACNIKSINNVVDITNYVMLEFGQPLHAFDAKKLVGEKIVVRRAEKGEKIITLDDEEKILDESILVIADSKNPVAVAGIIGGKISSISEQTQQIILEVACFEPILVRRGSNKIGVRTESVVRFEKDLALATATRGFQRAMELLQKYAQAELTGFTDTQTLDLENENILYREKIVLPAITLKRLTGVEIPAEKVIAILQNLGCKVDFKEKGDDTAYEVFSPWFRVDLNIVEDLIEEVVRIYGVNNIPEQKLFGELHVPKNEALIPLKRQVRNELKALGACEVYNYSFYSKELLEKAGLTAEKEQVEILNPLSEDLRYLRTSLLPRLLENLKRNSQEENITLFEIGHVYFTDREISMLGIVQSGKSAVYRQMRGLTEALLKALHVVYQTEIIKQTAPCEFWSVYQDDQALKITATNGILGTSGLIDKTILKNYDLEKPVAFTIISLDALAKTVNANFKIKAVSPYPAIDLDLSIIVPQETTWAEIRAEVVKKSQPYLEKIDVFDVYQGEKVGYGKKSIGFSLKLRSLKQTLQMTQMEKLREDIMLILAKKFQAVLRAK